MRERMVRRWRPLLGVVALGALAFGWSLTGTAAEKETKSPAQTSVRAIETADVAVTAPVDGAKSSAAVEGMSAPSQGRTITNVRTLVGPASAAAVADREVVRVRSSREDECTCDADCGDGNACTIDTCEFDGTDWVCVAVDADSGTICDDEGLAGDNLFCLAGGCDGAGTCVADNGPTPCNTGFTCNETEDRCESDECQGGDTCDDGEFCNGVESCNAENLCDSPGNPCFATGATCDEELDVCESPVNTGRCCYGREQRRVL